MSKEGMKETVVDVNRVTKVVKGGRRFSFSVGVIAGDGQGKVNFGRGKAKEVGEARAKAVQEVNKDLKKIPLYQGRTIHHDVFGKSGAARVVLRRAKAGTGIIAGGPMRIIFDRLGVKDIVAKSLGSNNVNSMIAATFDALSKLSSPKTIADRRGLKLQNLSTKASNLITME